MRPSASATAVSASGVTYRAGANDDRVTTLRLVFDADRCRFHLADHRGRHVVVAGGQWPDPKRFEMTWPLVETAFRDRVLLELEGGKVTMHIGLSVNSGTVVRPAVLARVQR